MLALQQCLPVPLDQHGLQVTLDHAAAAQMLPLPASCGLQKRIQASAYNAFKLCMTLHFASISRICKNIFRI
jgi:hypothetical protein